MPYMVYTIYGNAHIRQILEQHSLVKSPCVGGERRVWWRGGESVVGGGESVVGRRGECGDVSVYV